MYYFLKALLRAIFNLMFGARVIDKAKLATLGKKAVFLASNISKLDALLMMAYVPGRPVFAMSAKMYRGWAKFFLRFGDVFVINGTDPASLKGLMDAIKGERQAVIFAEGALCDNGLPTKLSDLAGLILEETKAPLVPVRLKGVEFSRSSMLPSSPGRRFPKIEIIFFGAHKSSEIIGAKSDRKRINESLFRIMQTALYESFIDRNASVFSALVGSMKLYGMNRKGMLEDNNRSPIGNTTCLVKSFALASEFNKFTSQGESVGIMLPNGLANFCTILGLTAYERVPAMINFGSGERSIMHCCKTAVIKTILTSRKFIEVLEAQSLITGLEKEGIKVKYLEDISKQIKLPAKLAAVWKAKRRHVPFAVGGHNKKFVVLFTSGSEGLAKAVALSHYNFLSNESQAITMLACFNPSDVCFNALPMFHSFGLLFTMLPVLTGCKLFLYPTPLHYKIIPELCYSVGGTILTGTDTFLKNYARNSHPSDFRSMRLVVCGAEALRDDTAAMWIEKFGIRIIHGYGATEASPVITLNTFTHNRNVSIGRVILGLEHKIKPIEGVKKGGELVVRGDNVMMGYMKIDDPGKVVPLKDGWYETGDIVELDEDGFVFITDRLKRFAKLAGEMVSLTQVENLVKEAFAKDGELDVKAVAVPDDVKGEKIVIVSTNPDLDLSRVADYAKRQKVSELYVPKTHMYMKEIPVLKTGKTDLITLKDMVLAAHAAKKA